MKVNLPVVQETETTMTLTFKPGQLPEFDGGNTPMPNIYTYFRAILATIYEVAPEREMLGADGRKFSAKFAVSPAVMLQVEEECSWIVKFGLDEIESNGFVPLQVVAAFMLGWCGWYDEERKKRN